MIDGPVARYRDNGSRSVYRVTRGGLSLPPPPHPDRDDNITKHEMSVCFRLSGISDPVKEGVERREMSAEIANLGRLTIYCNKM